LLADIGLFIAMFVLLTQNSLKIHFSDCSCRSQFCFQMRWESRVFAKQLPVVRRYTWDFIQVSSIFENFQREPKWSSCIFAEKFFFHKPSIQKFGTVLPLLQIFFLKHFPISFCQGQFYIWVTCVFLLAPFTAFLGSEKISEHILEMTLPQARKQGGRSSPW